MVHVDLPSWIYPLFPISLRRLNSHSAPLVRKTQWKEVFSLHGSQIERGYITMRQTTSRIVMHAWLLTETESWTVRILIRRSYSMYFPTGKMLAWPSRCNRDSVRGRNSCVQLVCDARCTDITFTRNISSNVPTKLINRNCTQDAIKTYLHFLNLKFYRRKFLGLPLRDGKTPSRVLPISCLRHSGNAFGVPWPDHFSKAGDGPGLRLMVKSRQKRQWSGADTIEFHTLPQTPNERETSTTNTAFKTRTGKSWWDNLSQQMATRLS